jgi:hypothetical protein
MTEPTTPQEIAEAKAEARRLRRQRQTAKNLVASLVASMGIVIFLVLVVARPNTPVAQPIDYVLVGAQTEVSSGYDLAVPTLDESWRANRADLREESGLEVWRVGFVSSAGGFVQIVHYLGEVTDPLSVVPAEGIDSPEPLIGGDGSALVWSSRDRTEVDDAGNDAYVLWRETTNGLLVVRGTAQAGVLAVASAVVTSDPQLFGARS